MNIGEAAKASGVTAKRIRHYEAVGLLAPPLRSEAGYRIYSGSDLHELRFIKSARSLGFHLDQIKQLLSLWRDKNRTSAEVKALALEQVDALTAKIDELTAMRDVLQDLSRRCHGDDRPDCPIISGLSEQ